MIAARERVFFDDFSFDQVALDYLFEDGGRTGVIPNCAGINYRDGAVDAYAKAICLCAIDKRLRADKIQFLQAAFQIFPRFQAGFLGAAFGFGLIRAKENVPGIFSYAQCFGGFL